MKSCRSVETVHAEDGDDVHSTLSLSPGGHVLLRAGRWESKLRAVVGLNCGPNNGRNLGETLLRSPESRLQGRKTAACSCVSSACLAQRSSGNSWPTRAVFRGRKRGSGCCCLPGAIGRSMANFRTSRLALLPRQAAALSYLPVARGDEGGKKKERF